MMPQRTRILGVPVDAVDMESALQQVQRMMAGDDNNLVFAVNPEKVMAAQRDPGLLEALEQASMLVPDGIGVVLAARLLAGIRMKRVPGSDLMPEICRLAATRKQSVFLYGAKPGVAEQAARVLQSRYPGLTIAGTQHGYLADDEIDTFLQKINNSGASALFVGLGSPRQELWLTRFKSRLNVRICQGVGGTFDALCGNPKRAPRWVQSLYMEWLHRLVLQPNRAQRQSALPAYVMAVARELANRRKPTGRS